jgi:hypothetical protein
VLDGLLDLLAEGGVSVVQEYSIARATRFVNASWAALSWFVIIPRGWLTSRRTRLYRPGAACGPSTPLRPLSIACTAQGLLTPHARIVLAGDGIRSDFSVALIERAATTGFLAPTSYSIYIQCRGP